MNGFDCQSTGVLVATPSPPKLHVEVDQGIVDLARALRPKAVKLARQRYAPHITTMREEAVDPVLWATSIKRLHGREIHFQYDPRVCSGRVYWWLRAWSKDLLDVRRSLQLPDFAWGVRPPGGEECFHITIGNTKK